MDILSIVLSVNAMFAVMPSYDIGDPEASKHVVITNCSGAARLNNKVYFGSDSYATGCLYVLLSQEEAATLGENLIEWAKNPYMSHVIYRKDLP